MGPEESAVETLCKAVGILAAKVDDLHAKMEQVESGIRMDNEKTKERSSGTMLSCNEVAVSDVNKNDSNKTDGCRGDSIPIEPLFVMNGTFNGMPVRILKDDGCNTNVVSRKFVQRNAEAFKTIRRNVKVNHSDDDRVEQATQIILDGRLKVGNHEYLSNFVVANCRYDVLLGMPWHVASNPQVSYPARVVQLKDDTLPVMTGAEEFGRVAKVHNMSIKRFRKELRQMRTRDDFKAFQLVELSNMDCTPDEKRSIDPKMQSLLKEYSDVFRSELPDGLPPKRSVDHAIETENGAKPPHRSLYQLSPAELQAAKEYVVDLMKKGKIRPSKSPYGAPLFFVKDGDKPLRGVVDYRALNRITKRNNAPLPRSDEMFDRLGGARVFSKLDLKTGFHQIRLRPEDIEKTAFNTKYGQFEYLVMPMGLCNAPATFQTLMNNIFYDCIDDFLVLYMDDLLIFSKNEEDHMMHVEEVLQRLRQHNLYVSPKKCVFMSTEMDFLGLIVGKDGLRVDPKKMDVIKNWPRPANITEVRSFLGLVQFFRRFIARFSEIAVPLTNLTKKNQSIGKWDSKCEQAFAELKHAVTSAPILRSPDWKKPFKGHIDASQLAVGGTLTQMDEDDLEHPVAFHSKKLSPAEANYSANDRELLALISFLQRFRCYLEGTEFEILTDNQVLKHFFTKPSLSRREARWSEILGNFGVFPITMKPGKIHVLGDSLSRAPHVINSSDETSAVLNSTEVPYFDRSEILKNYEDDQFFGPVVRAMRNEWPMHEHGKRQLERMLPYFTKDNDGCLLYQGKMCLPRRSIASILQVAHDSKIGGHFGLAKTMSRLSNFHWRHMLRDVRNYVKGCMRCQQFKDSRQKSLTDPNPLEMPSRRWGSVSTDFITHLPKTKDGYDCITTWVDRISRRVHFIPSRSSDTAVDAAKSFYGNIFKLHGLPDEIVSDRDPKFTSKFWRTLMDLCGVKLKMSTSRHPQTDGSSEIMNRMLENYLRCYCSYRQDDWAELLPSAEFAYNSAISEDLGTSPFEVDLGWCPRSPLDLLSGSRVSVESVEEFKTALQASIKDAQYSYKISRARQAAQSSMRYSTPQYSVGDYVWLKNTLFMDAYSRSQESAKLRAKRFGPFRIVELVGKNAVKLELPDHLRIHPVVHVIHTTPHYDQPLDISSPVPVRPTPVPTALGPEYEVESILAHRRRGRGYQFLTLMRGDPIHDAEWQPARDFIDPDGTMTEALQKYVQDQNLDLPLTRTSMKGGGQ